MTEDQQVPITNLAVSWVAALDDKGAAYAEVVVFAVDENNNRLAAAPLTIADAIAFGTGVVRAATFAAAQAQVTEHLKEGGASDEEIQSVVAAIGKAPAPPPQAPPNATPNGGIVIPEKGLFVPPGFGDSK